MSYIYIYIYVCRMCILGCCCFLGGGGICSAPHSAHWSPKLCVNVFSFLHFFLAAPQLTPNSPPPSQPPMPPLPSFSSVRSSSGPGRRPPRTRPPSPAASAPDTARPWPRTPRRRFRTRPTSPPVWAAARCIAGSKQSLLPFYTSLQRGRIPHKPHRPRRLPGKI